MVPINSEFTTRKWLPISYLSKLLIQKFEIDRSNTEVLLQRCKIRFKEAGWMITTDDEIKVNKVTVVVKSENWY